MIEHLDVRIDGATIPALELTVKQAGRVLYDAARRFWFTYNRHGQLDEQLLQELDWAEEVCRAVGGTWSDAVNITGLASCQSRSWDRPPSRLPRRRGADRREPTRRRGSGLGRCRQRRGTSSASNGARQAPRSSGPSPTG